MSMWCGLGHRDAIASHMGIPFSGTGDAYIEAMCIASDSGAFALKSWVEIPTVMPNNSRKGTTNDRRYYTKRRSDPARACHARGCERLGRHLWRLGFVADGYRCGQRGQGHVATVAVDAMKFIRPVHVGDILCVFARIEREGRTSMGVGLEAWVLRDRFGAREKVTEAIFTFVAIDEDGKPRPLPPE
jgi:acyl-CoA thioesterase FadM